MLQHVVRTRPRLVGQPLIYAMTLFISLGVFLVRVISFNTDSVQTTDPPRSLVMIRGSRLPQLSRKIELTELLKCNVRYHYRTLFQGILQRTPCRRVGFNGVCAGDRCTEYALENFAGTLQPAHPVLMLHSNFACCWAHRRLDRPQGHSIHWCGDFHCWRGNSNLHRGYPQHGFREVYLRVWCWVAIVGVYPVIPHGGMTLCSGRLYRFTRAKFHHQTTYVSCPPGSPPTDSNAQRGALACMEFTGNIFGYASSVVCVLDSLIFPQLSADPAVDRLLFVLYRIGLVLANTLVHSMCHRSHSRSWISCYA